MPDRFKALELLRSLADFDDPMGPAASLQMMEELRQEALAGSQIRYRLTEEGPEQTAVEILAEIEADRLAVAALRGALSQQRRHDS